MNAKKIVQIVLYRDESIKTHEVNQKVMKDPQYVVEGTKDAHLHIQTIQYPDLRHMIDIENEVVGEVVGQ